MVYVSDDSDVEVGCTHLCIECATRFYLPDLDGDASKADDPHHGTLQELRRIIGVPVSAG